jgi:glycosyltransferase involved in cell wall biosynthesis
MNKSINHVFVFLEIFSQEGGIQSYVKDVLSAYCSLESGYRAEIFLLRDEVNNNNPCTSDLIKFHYLKTLPPWKGRLKLAFALLTCLLKYHPERVFCGHINLAPLVNFSCRLLGIPYTVLTYGKEVWQPLPIAKRTALKQASSIWTISHYSRERLCDSNNINHQKVEILPCVVDQNRFTPAKKPQELLAKYGLENARVLMTVARLWSGDIYKGVDVTIRALPKIIETNPDLKYLVIGRGDDQPRLAQLAQDLGVSAQVVFAGFVPTEDLANHYRLADAYIMPSQEGFGIVYLEAMSCGVPVLSGDNDGSADPLQDGLLGWRVPHRDPQAVAKATIEILQGNDQRCQGQWLREKTIEKFSQQALPNILQRLLNSELG